jgi:hypothetical protein
LQDTATELSEIPAATVQPVDGERENAVISGAPSSDVATSVASSLRDVSANSEAGARLPTVSCGFGTRANTVPAPSISVIVQSAPGRCFSTMLWNISSGGEKEMS